MKNIFLLFIISLIFSSSFLSPHCVYIIIHGTWGAESPWYKPGGDFFEALDRCVKKCDDCVVPFRWSGDNSIEARNNAARSLAHLIEAYDKTTEVVTIGHSHGGTVAILASHLLKSQSIKYFYTLGTPVNKSLYPNMSVIDQCYNLFSFEDLVQPVFGIFGREFAKHERVVNIRIVINGKEPDHTNLHHMLVGGWLADLPAIMSNSGVKTTEPGVIYFDNTKEPVYVRDTQRKDLLERDRRLSLLMLNSLSRKIYTDKLY